jgi:hypothetical protein
MPMDISSLCLRNRGRPVPQAVTDGLLPRRSGLQITTLHLGFVLQDVTLEEVLSVELRFLLQ